MNILKEVEKEQIAKLSEGKSLPTFKPGDTLKVHTKVKEGDRERIQVYEGVPNCISCALCAVVPPVLPTTCVPLRRPRKLPFRKKNNFRRLPDGHKTLFFGRGFLRCMLCVQLRDCPLRGKAPLRFFDHSQTVFSSCLPGGCLFGMSEEKISVRFL